jgi:ABC-2 type transport system permease protein
VTLEIPTALPSASVAAPLRSPWLFQRLRWRLFVNSGRAMVEASGLRLFVILICSTVVAGCVFGVCDVGFTFLRDKRLLDTGEVPEMLFDLLFFALFMMLVFSTGLILYGSLFSSAETGFLMSMPARADQVFAYKYQGAIAFSSWAFVLLGCPMLVAYGLVGLPGEHAGEPALLAPWYFYALLPLFFFGFVLLPGSLGAALCLLVVNFVPRRRKQIMWVLAITVIGLVSFWFYSVLSTTRADVWSRETAQALVGRFTFAQRTITPSHWMSRGVISAAARDLDQTAYNLALIWGNGLFLYLVTTGLAVGLYRRGYNRVATGGELRRRYGGHWLDQALSRILGFVDAQTRLLIVKDFRTFRRDPKQWAQVVIFVGLLCLYFANLPNIHQFDESEQHGGALAGLRTEWAERNAISLLNMGATALLLCTYTSRFIYPMLSLEGRKFWILGLLPLERDRLLWGKFMFAATAALLIAESLVLLSDVMLRIPLIGILLHVVTVATLAVGLSGLSVGIGACLPNFRETDPSKIAVGFGGTLNLIAGLLFLMVTISFMAAPWHMVMMPAEDGSYVTPMAVAGVVIGLLVGVATGIAAIMVPLQVGAAALRKMEF